MPKPGETTAGVELNYAWFDGQDGVSDLLIFHSHPDKINEVKAWQPPSTEDVENAKLTIRVVYSPKEGKVYLYNQDGVKAETTPIIFRK